jgi:hypothetical protein
MSPRSVTFKIHGVPVKHGDPIEVRMSHYSDDWAKRQFDRVDGGRIWAIPTGLDGSDAAHWPGAFELRNVRIGDELTAITKAMTKP